MPFSLAVPRPLRRMGGACFSGISGAAGLNKNVPPNRRQFALINHCKQMGAQMSLPSERSSDSAGPPRPRASLQGSRPALPRAGTGVSRGEHELGPGAAEADLLDVQLAIGAVDVPHHVGVELGFALLHLDRAF